MLYDYLVFNRCEFFVIILIQFCDKHIIFKNYYVKKVSVLHSLGLKFNILHGLTLLHFGVLKMHC